MEGAKPPEPKHLLTLKVMRLTRPTFYKSDVVHLDARDIDGAVKGEGPFAAVARDDITLDEDAPSSNFSRTLMLPQTFMNIYLGETFSSYVAIHNGSGHRCTDVTFKAEVQTPSLQTVVPTAHSQPVDALEPGSSLDDIIQLEMKEMGSHMLICSVSYMMPVGEKTFEKMLLRKFYRFQVLKPLDLKTKFLPSEDYASNDVYLETQVQNITSNVMYLERVALEPSAQFECEDLSELVLRNTFNKYISPLDSFQFLFRLTPKKAVQENQKLLRSLTDMGRLDITWRTAMGESSHLQTSALHRVVPGFGDIRLYVKSLPAEAYLESPVDVTFTLTNCSERTINPRIEMCNDKQASVIWTGISGRQLGDLEPNCALDFHLVFIPVITGLASLSGIKVIDTFLQRLYEHDDIAHIFVKPENEAVVEHMV